MNRVLMWALPAALALAGGAAAFGFAAAGTTRADCPGKIVCPLTGEEVCEDQCPLVDASRPDCPGRVECPQTGELVCRDRCPLNAEASSSVSEPATRSCCRGN